MMGDKECAALGLAIPGAVDQISGKVAFSTEFNLVNVPIVKLLEDRLERPVTAINRAYAAALAESWLGVAKDARNVLYIRMGEYLGGAILIDGLPYLGSQTTGVASIAHITVNPDGLPCRCGSRGCLDTVASGNAIARFAREEIKNGRASTLVDQTNGYLDLITGTMVVEAARQGDTVCVDALHEAAHWMGIAVGIVVNLLGPDIIVFGGELGRVAGEGFLARTAEEARRYTYSMPNQAVNLLTSALGPEAVACGAAATALWETLTHSISLHLG
jgi:predicted NBD/HSP70 family sugar kinase